MLKKIYIFGASKFHVLTSVIIINYVTECKTRIMLSFLQTVKNDSVIMSLLQNILKEALADVYFEIVVEELTARLDSIGILQLVSLHDSIVEVSIL